MRIVLTAFAVVLLIGTTYAFITQTLTGTKQVVINAGVLDLVLEEENAITISNALPMYDQVGMIQEDVFVFRLVNKTSNPTNYILKLSKINVDNELSPSDVKYYLTKEGIGEPKLLSSLAVDGTVDSGTIEGNDTIDYTLRLWIDSNVTSNDAIAGKTLSYKIDVEVSQEIAKSSSSAEVKLFADENLGENCKTYDDGTDTFLVGQCSNNYVWYSGKLWRIVLKNNETGAVKMVTDNAITVIPYNGGVTFENGYVDQWLNQEFLPTLHDYEDYLVVDSIWDATINSSSTPERPSYTTKVTRTVGLLNTYEHYTTYNNSDGLATNSLSYLNARVSWWLMTAYDSNYYVNIINNYGLQQYYKPSYGNGVRPSVNLQSGVQISGGSGIKSEPYILEGDMQEPVSGTTLLNTRYSGEYVTFNDELYRIVNIENGLTKITAVDKPSSLSSNKFNSSEGITSFTNASIKTDLENYYQGLKTTNETTYNMIESNTTWYLGKVGGGSNYKRSICATVDKTKSMNECTEKAASTTASIGLPRIGEMFTSYSTRGTKSDFWTLTPYDEYRVNYLESYDGSLDSDYPTLELGARPSMYLKSGVKIARSNTGNGTYEHPYEIEMSDFLINNGTEYTNNQTVTLSLFGGTGVQMCISNTENCTNYESFSTSKQWTLLSGDGEKTVYVYYKDSSGNIIANMSKSIILDTTAPSNNSIEISSEDNTIRTLTLSSTGADYMCFSNTSSNVSDCTSWVEYKTTYNWSLTPNSGEKTVYAFFKDKVGNTASTSASVTCNNCVAFTVSEDFNDTTYDSNLTIAGSGSYPWTVDTTSLYFRSNNKGVNNSSSTSTIEFTPTNASKLSFDWGVSSESNYDKLTIKLTGSDSSSVTLVDAQSGTQTGSITDQTLNANVTYTLTLTYTKDGSQNKNSDIGYIDNLHVGP